MDEEEKYWFNFEKIYVHNVYETISSKYDDFIRISREQQDKLSKCDDKVADCVDVLNNNNNTEDIDDETSQILKNKLVLNLNRKSSKSKDKSRHNHINKHNPWPKVKQFLLQLEPNSLIADIGCGEGKYLNLNTQSFTIGCDRSISLSKLASVKHHSQTPFINQNQVVVCDNLSLPFRSNFFDAVISIGVIHHISTHKRRVKAVQELVRILNVGGKVMIYVWAMEQRLRNFNSQDVLVPTLNTNLNGENEYKYRHLRRDLSNTSSANSEDSNDECFSPSIEQLNKRSSLSKTSANISNKRNSLKNANLNKSNDQEIPKTSNDTITKDSNDLDSSGFDEKLSDQTENKFEKDLDKETKETKLKESIGSDIGEKSNSNANLVENLKRFFKDKFSSTNDIPLTHQVSLQLEQKKVTIPILNQQLSLDLSKTNSPILSRKPFANLLKKQEKVETPPLHKINSIERYKQILEEHKDLLPKNFTLRQFPYSSCQDTFDEPNETEIIITTTAKEASNENLEIKNTSNSEKVLLDIQSTSSASLSPSPVNNYTSSANGLAILTYSSSSSLSPLNQEKTIDFSQTETINNETNGSESDLNWFKINNKIIKNSEMINNQKGLSENLNEDSDNKNRRYYHVFKRNELCNLIKENCPNLTIYESYYDHGNWVICGRKERE